MRSSETAGALYPLFLRAEAIRRTEAWLPGRCFHREVRDNAASGALSTMNPPMRVSPRSSERALSGEEGTQAHVRKTNLASGSGNDRWIRIAAPTERQRIRFSSLCTGRAWSRHHAEVWRMSTRYLRSGRRNSPRYGRSSSRTSSPCSRASMTPAWRSQDRAPTGFRKRR